MDTNSWLLVAILTVLVLSWLTRGSSSGELARLRGVDRKLDLICSNLGIDPNQGIDKQLVDLVRSGQKIDAIKLYRLQTGVGLKEAKDYIESL